MSYAIMRCKKLKGMGSVAASLQHYFRERDTPNADPERTPDNQYKVGQSVDDTMGRLRDKLPEKRRKDAVICVEYMMSASPEWWKTASKGQQQAFFQQSAAWLVDKYGKENIIGFGIHKDETTPHVSAFVVPMTKDGRLSAKDYIGGRQKLRDDQTSYAKTLEPLGLQRGIEGSTAEHQEVSRHYGVMKNLPKLLENAKQEERARMRAAALELAEKAKKSIAKHRQTASEAVVLMQDAQKSLSAEESLTARLRATVAARDKEIGTLKAENRELQQDNDHDLGM